MKFITLAIIAIIASSITADIYREGAYSCINSIVLKARRKEINREQFELRFRNCAGRNQEECKWYCRNGLDLPDYSKGQCFNVCEAPNEYRTGPYQGQGASMIKKQYQACLDEARYLNKELPSVYNLQTLFDDCNRRYNGLFTPAGGLGGAVYSCIDKNVRLFKENRFNRQQFEFRFRNCAGRDQEDCRQYCRNGLPIPDYNKNQCVYVCDAPDQYRSGPYQGKGAKYLKWQYNYCLQEAQELTNENPFTNKLEPLIAACDRRYMDLLGRRLFN